MALGNNWSPVIRFFAFLEKPHYILLQGFTLANLDVMCLMNNCKKII